MAADTPVSHDLKHGRLSLPEVLAQSVANMAPSAAMALLPLLVFAGAGAIMVDANTNALGHVGVAITFGLVIMVMIYAVGHVSGAHFNPAVSAADWCVWSSAT